MAAESFKTSVEALTGYTFNTTTSPTQDDLTSFIKQSIKEVYHRVVNFYPNRMVDFSSTIAYIPGSTVASLVNTGVVMNTGTPTNFMRTDLAAHNLSAGDKVRIEADPDTHHFHGTVQTIAASGLTSTVFELEGIAGGGPGGSFTGTFTRVGVSGTGGHDIQGVPIITVRRYDDTNSAWRNCDKISVNQWGPSQDTDSFHYKDTYSPAYVLVGGKMHILPEATVSDMAEIDAVVFDENITLDSSAPANFPLDLIYAVTLNAATKSLSVIISDLLDSLSSSPILRAFPDSPTLEVISYEDMQSVGIDPEDMVMPIAPTYTSTWSNVTDLTLSAILPVSPTVPAFASQTVSSAAEVISNMTSTPPVFDSSAVSNLSGTYLTNEDPELASVAIQKQSADVQQELNEFNEANNLWQTELQIRLQNLQVLAAKYQKESDQAFQSLVQKFQSDVGLYQQDLARYQAQVQKEVQEWQVGILQKYTTQIQDNTAIFNADNTRYQAEMQHRVQQLQQDFQKNIKTADNLQQQRMQKAIKDMEVIIQNNTQALSEYGQEIQGWSGEAQVVISKYTQDLQKDTAKLQGYQKRLDEIRADYASSILPPKPEEASGVRR